MLKQEDGNVDKNVESEDGGLGFWECGVVGGR